MIELLNKVGTSLSHWSGLSSDDKNTVVAGNYGSTFFETDTKDGFIYSAAGWVYDSITALKRQNQIAKPTSHSLVFGASDTVKTSAVAYNGMVKHLHLVVPNFTNVVTATVTLVDASGRILWSSAAKAKNASYNLEAEAEWVDQLVDNTLIWTVTCGAPGGSGGTVVLVPRYYGV